MKIELLDELEIEQGQVARLKHCPFCGSTNLDGTCTDIEQMGAQR